MAGEGAEHSPKRRPKDMCVSLSLSVCVCLFVCMCMYVGGGCLQSRDTAEDEAEEQRARLNLNEKRPWVCSEG